MATDTSWRTDPPRFPVRWLVPALAVIAVTIVVGVLRYPDLPARLVAGWGGRRVPKSVLAAFAVVIGHPAIMVGARFGVGFTFNVANPMAWLVIAGIVAVPVGLVAIGAAARM